MKYKYTAKCVDGNTMTFTTSTNVDFHKISNGALSFNDLYINLSNVICIRKEVVEEEKPENESEKTPTNEGGVGICDRCKYYTTKLYDEPCLSCGKTYVNFERKSEGRDDS